MICIQIYLTEEQYSKLKEEATKANISMSALVRKIVTKYYELEKEKKKA